MINNKKVFIDRLQVLAADGDESARQSLSLLISGDTRLVEDGDGRVSVVAKKVRTPVELPPRRFRHFPEDLSIVEEVRRVMTKNDGAVAIGFDEIGIDKPAYTLIAKLLTIRSQNVPQQCLDTIDEALRSIEETRNVGRARKMTAEILARFWQVKKDSSFAVRQRRRRFEQTLIHIGESCQSTADMELPRDLSQREVREAIATLAASVELVGRLMRRLTGEDI